MTSHSYAYDFVISYASENILVAEALYTALTARGAKVFYAPEYQGEMWGANLYEYLKSIYSEKGLFFVPIISKPYIEKQWTRHEWRSAQERVLKETSKAYVLPIQIDDIKLPGLFETTSYLDIRKVPIEQIAQYGISKLEQHRTGNTVEVIKEEAKQAESAGWEPLLTPSQRNSFLVDNHYLNRKSDQFGKHRFQRSLVAVGGEANNGTVTCVAIPSPEPRYVELENVTELLDINRSPYGQKLGNQTTTNSDWLFFNFSNLAGQYSTPTDYIRYEPVNYESKSGDFVARRYLRFTEDGALEFSEDYYSVFFSENTNLRVFNFIFILGTAWRFINLAAAYYSKTNYQGNFQFILNLIDTYEAALGQFASAPNARSGWSSPVSEWAADRMTSSGTGSGITHEKNLQFTYEIDTAQLMKRPEISEDIMVSLSRKLQRSFDYKVEERQYIRGTKQFPWHQFHQLERY